MSATEKVASRQRNEAGFRAEQESPVFNQIKFLKLAVKTGWLWFARVYQVWGREAQRTQASCCHGRPQRTFDFHCTICYQIWSTSPVIGFTSITLILPQPLWTWTTKKKKVTVASEQGNEYSRAKVLRLGGLPEELFPIKMYSWGRDLFFPNPEIWNCSYLGLGKVMI